MSIACIEYKLFVDCREKALRVSMGKLRKDGIPKRSGLQEGDRRVSRPLSMKLQVVDEYRLRQRKKANGQCCAPLQETAEQFNVHKSLVSKWAAQEDELRRVVSQASVTRFSLNPGSKCRFPLAEADTYTVCKEHRTNGLRVTARFLRVAMRRSILEHYGEMAATSFRASHRWLQAFARRHRLSLRRKTNSKHMPIEARLAKCKRWHARFRRRLRRASSTAPLHETWGRWLPQDRISIDQVPCNLREGDGRTYAEVGSKRVWLVGSKQDDGKRFCTLQVAARCANGSPNLPRHGQARLLVIFRGTGKRISPEEREAWHPGVWVRFQKKAWADEALCEDYALVEMAEITAAARLAGRESVAIFDNLHGQTTQTHLANLARNRCKRHLLPSNTTDELQLVDAGVGHALKTEMAHLHDDWLSKDDNLELWTTATNFPVWRKRALVTWLAAQAWENVCRRFDFEAAATRLGMRMTIDGSGDELIRMQGMEQYFFCDDDGGGSDYGSEAMSEVGGMEQMDGLQLGSQEDAQVEMHELSGNENENENESTLLMGAQSIDEMTRTESPISQHNNEMSYVIVEYDCNPSSNEEAADISFAEHSVKSCLPQAEAPPGYIIVETCPPLDTRRQQRSLVGKMILYGWEDYERTGWFVGRVAHNRVTARDKREVATANFVVRYTATQTDGQIDGLVACELSARTYGASQWWVLLQHSRADLCHRSAALGRSDSSNGEQLGLL